MNEGPGNATIRTALALVAWTVALIVLTVDAQGPPPSPAVTDLPKSVDVALREWYGGLGPVRYVSAWTELNGDETPEIVVHLIGPTACGRAGCDTFVFSPSGDQFREVARISIPNPSIRVSTRSTNGWRNLIATVQGEGIKAQFIELEYDGTRYLGPVQSTGLTPVDTTGAELVIQGNVRSLTAKVLIQ
jgi:hypothetical protein